MVTIQHVSGKAPDYSTYQPYLNKLDEFFRICVPKAKLAVQQTWAYEQGSQRLESLGYTEQAEMFADVKAAYDRAADSIGADFIIPSGEAFQKMIASGVEKIHRDTFHASLGLGRYTLGLLWYLMLTGNNIENNTFSDFDEEIEQDKISLAKKCATEAAAEYRK
ncbi:MAG: DUF4886 domain-containing protein [Clostridia bacterium]|nr:DUF4886 domain-containing protein [Clostridia bacterium]